MGHFRTLSANLALMLALASCQTPPPPVPPSARVAFLPDDLLARVSAEAALEFYYRTLPEDFFPRAPSGVSLPGD